jgi:hypothetical protein
MQRVPPMTVRRLIDRCSVQTALWAAVALCSGHSPAFAGVFEQSDTKNLPACQVSVLSSDSAALRESAMSQTCGGDHLQFALDGPKPRADLIPGASASASQSGANLAARTKPMSAQFQTTFSERFSLLMTNVKFGWAAQHDDLSGRLRTQTASVAATGSLKLDPAWLVQLGLGRELAAGPRTRTTMSSVWQPTSRGLLYTEWADTDGIKDGQLLGGRWWLIGKRLALDVAAQRAGNGSGWVNQRVGLTLSSELR